jgi:hypothetical protein
VHDTALPTLPHDPDAELTLVTLKDPDAGTLSVTVKPEASDGPLFVTTIV